jgi:hypothetical protein
VQLKLQLGLRNVLATALMRDYRAQDMAFEIVDMSLDERSKYRRLLADNNSQSTPTANTKSQSAIVEAPTAS